MVQYSYSLYTAAVTGGTDSRSDENGPPPTKKRKSNYYLLPEARVGGHGYYSVLVCLSVCNGESTLPQHVYSSMDSLHTTSY